MVGRVTTFQFDEFARRETLNAAHQRCIDTSVKPFLVVLVELYVVGQTTIFTPVLVLSLYVALLSSLGKRERIRASLNFSHSHLLNPHLRAVLVALESLANEERATKH